MTVLFCAQSTQSWNLHIYLQPCSDVETIADLHNSPAFLWLEKNTTKTHAIDIHTFADGKFVINTCRFWWRSSRLATMYDDVTVTKWCLNS